MKITGNKILDRIGNRETKLNSDIRQMQKTRSEILFSDKSILDMIKQREGHGETDNAEDCQTKAEILFLESKFPFGTSSFKVPSVLRMYQARSMIKKLKERGMYGQVQTALFVAKAPENPGYGEIVVLGGDEEEKEEKVEREKMYISMINSLKERGLYGQRATLCVAKAPGHPGYGEIVVHGGDEEDKEGEEEEEKGDDQRFIKNIESEAKDMKKMIKSYTDKMVASKELNIILSDMKSIDFNKNQKILQVREVLEQMQLEAKQWEEKWEVLQSKEQDFKQDADVSQEMGDLEKALLEETHMMHKRQELKIELLNRFQERQDNADSRKHMITEVIESEMVTIWRTPEVQTLQSALEQMHWEDTPKIQEKWTSVKIIDKLGLLEFEEYGGTLLSTIDEELSNESKQLEENQNMQDDMVINKEFKITKSTEKTPEILQTTMFMTLSKHFKIS